MLSLRQSYEVRTSVIEYLKAAFSFKEKEEAEAFLRFIEGEETGLFKGLYLPLKLPFEKSDTAIFATHNSNIPVLEDGEQLLGGASLVRDPPVLQFRALRVGDDPDHRAFAGEERLEGVRVVGTVLLEDLRLEDASVLLRALVVVCDRLLEG